MLHIENLTFSYPHRSVPVIDSFDLSLERGGIYGLLGPNGAGKSTLLYLICGLLTPRSGQVVFNGLQTRHREPATLCDIFIVPEELNLPAMSLDKYVKLTSPFYPRFSQEDLNRHLATFGVSDIASRKLTSLSMGLKKKVFMSFALACNTSLLLMDEPTNGLDIPGKAAFRRFIASTASDDRIVIISTHQVRDIDSILDHVIIMDEHKVRLNASIGDISTKLAFLTTNDPSLIERAYVRLATPAGTQIVIANDGEYDTDVNLETLFELASQHRDIVEPLFNRSNPELS